MTEMPKGGSYQGDVATLKVTAVKHLNHQIIQAI
jgi:hypothetical protein